MEKAITDEVKAKQEAVAISHVHENRENRPSGLPIGPVGSVVVRYKTFLKKSDHVLESELNLGGHQL